MGGFGFPGSGFGKGGAGSIGGGGGVPLPTITDLFTGFDSRGTFAGGPVRIYDNMGILQTSPANVLPVQGGRLSYDLAEGATLGPELFTGSLYTGVGVTVGGQDATHVITFSATGARFQSDTTTPALAVTAGAGSIAGRTYRVLPVFTTVSGLIKTDFFSTSDILTSGVPLTKKSVSIGACGFTRSGTNVDITMSAFSIKEVIPVWLPTAANGSPLWPSQSIRTRKGSVQKFDSTFLGMLNEPARTNKVTCQKSNPTVLTNLTKSGDAAATLTIIDDTAALTAAGLIGVCTNGGVYKLDNSAGVVAATATCGGATGNTNPHSGGAYIRGSGQCTLRLSSLPTVIKDIPVLTSAFVRYIGENKTGTSVGEVFEVRAAAGAVVYFILPQLEEGAFCTSVIPGDTLATVTRPASVYTRVSAGVLRGNTQGIAVRVVPEGAGQSGIAWGSYVDGANFVRIRILSSSVQFSKFIAGVEAVAYVNYIHTAGVPFVVMAHQDPVNGMKIRVKEDLGAWTAYGTNASVVDMPIGATYQEGGLNGASQFAGGYPFIVLFQCGLVKMEGLV